MSESTLATLVRDHYFEWMLVVNNHAKSIDYDRIAYGHECNHDPDSST